MIPFDQFLEICKRHICGYSFRKYLTKDSECPLFKECSKAQIEYINFKTSYDNLQKYQRKKKLEKLLQ